MELQKAIAHPVNAISSQSAAHLRDKVGRLVNLLSGKTVTIADMPINATQHPQGRAFCLEYLAKKLVVRHCDFVYLYNAPNYWAKLVVVGFVCSDYDGNWGKARQAF